MDYFKAMEISAAGMTAQKARIEAATVNLANMNTSAAPGAVGFRPVKAVIHAEPATFSAQMRPGDSVPMLAKAEFAVQASAPRLAYEPGHPHADASGMVAYPAVDHTQEMLTVMTAMRNYEANLAVLHISRTLATKALDIGGQ